MKRHAGVVSQEMSDAPRLVDGHFVGNDGEAPPAGSLATTSAGNAPNDSFASLDAVDTRTSSDVVLSAA